LVSDFEGGTWIEDVSFEVFTAVTTNNAVLWDDTPCGVYKIWRSGGTWIPIIRLMIVELCSSETSVLKRATWPNNLEDDIVHSLRVFENRAR
jgi:hypothetical protein